MSDGILDRLGLGALAGFAIGVAVAGNPDDRRSPQQFARETLTECLRLLEDPRLAAALPAVGAAGAAALPQSGAAGAEEPRPRRRRRTRAEIEADNAAAAAAAPAGQAEPQPRRRGRRPRQETAQAGAAGAAGAGEQPSGATPRRRRGAAPAEEAPQPARRGRRPRQQAEGQGDAAAAAAPAAAPPPEAAARPGREADSRVNLNAATRGELMRLPRIGAQAADRIIEFRDREGRISGARQLRQADLVSAAQWRQIRELVRF